MTAARAGGSKKEETRLRSGPHPGPGHAGARLEAVDGGGLLHGEADIVQPVQQAMLAEGIDVEMDAPAIRPGDLLLLEIDGDDGVGAALGVVHQLVDLGLGQLDGQDAVLEAVVVEDVREARSDDAAYPEI